ncbi:unnamed protein product, partial [Candidula unifasciata]
SPDGIVTLIASINFQGTPGFEKCIIDKPARRTCRRLPVYKETPITDIDIF